MKRARKFFYIGVKEICRCLHIGQPKLWKWIETEGLSVGRLPDGRWCLGRTELDEWLRILKNKKANQSGWTVPKFYKPRGPQALADNDIIFETETT